MARIGLISDSHARAAITARAATMLAEAGAECLLHMGDLCAEEVFDALLVTAPETGQILPVHVVFGNMDLDADRMERYARGLGIHVDHPAGRLTFDGVRLAFTHGHERSAVLAALEEGVDYLFYGHTHVATDEQRARTRLINPGALFRTAVPTVALLDTATGDLASMEVARK